MDLDWRRRRRGHMDRIAQRPPEPFECNLHDISGLKGDARAEAQAIRSEEVNVNVARSPVSLKLEVMMLEVSQTVAHLGFSGSESSGPDRTPAPVDVYRH